MSTRKVFCSIVEQTAEYNVHTVNGDRAVEEWRCVEANCSKKEGCSEARIYYKAEGRIKRKLPFPTNRSFVGEAPPPVDLFIKLDSEENGREDPCDF